MLLLVLILAVLALAACGGGGPSEQTVTHEPAETAAAPTTAPEPEPTTAPTTGEAGTDVVSDVVYLEEPGAVPQTLDVLAPATGSGPWPVAVMIHGGEGSYAVLAQQTLRPWAEAVARRGAVVFLAHHSIDVSTAKKARASLDASSERLACAVRFARAEAEGYGGDSSSVTLFGWSSGANIAALAAFGGPEVPEGCVARSGSAVPDSLVLFEGDWLAIGGGAHQEGQLREDPQLMDAITPWSHLEAATRMPVHVLDSNDPSLCGPADGPDLELRDPTGGFRKELEQLGAFDDGQLCEAEANRLFYERLKSLGYPATFELLPDSSHEILSDEAVQILGDAILRQQ